jgi:hypothetical protein
VIKTVVLSVLELNMNKYLIGEIRASSDGGKTWHNCGTPTSSEWMWEHSIERHNIKYRYTNLKYALSEKDIQEIKPVI